ncbi:MAG TPA: XRE family transcriptional regulator [Lachnospiraceae bacterium]|nr:XRE family transcriptional regulator [Lachnospiraceae bacterium]
MSSKTTKELTNALIKSEEIEAFLNSNKDEFLACNFLEQLLYFLHLKHKTKADVIKLANLNRTYGYEIFRGEKIPSRDKFIALSFGLELNFEETQTFLKRTENRELYSRDKRDSLIIYCISKEMNLIETNSFLYSMNEAVID